MKKGTLKNLLSQVSVPGPSVPACYYWWKDFNITVLGLNVIFDESECSPYKLLRLRDERLDLLKKVFVWPLTFPWIDGFKKSLAQMLTSTSWRVT